MRLMEFSDLHIDTRYRGYATSAYLYLQYAQAQIRLAFPVTCTVSAMH
jgi:hypothetical protein